MYISLKDHAAPSAEPKPRVLLVLQGFHHLMLYENVFKYCTQIQWYCLFPGLSKSRDVGGPSRLYHSYGVRFFSDASACLAHFGHFDAVITTWAVPHAKHLPYLKFIALAHELGLPVFELQHGLFQLGLTYSEHAPIIGSGPGSAISAPDAENLTTNVLKWFGEGGIGYPRSLTFENRERNPPHPGAERVVFVTNHHWGVLSEDERQTCYNSIYQTIRNLGAVDFVLLPHSGELKNPDFIDMIARLDNAKIKNYRIENGRDGGIYDDLLCDSNLIVASASTTILDCELSGTPTVMFRNESQEMLLGSFETVTTFSNAEELVQLVSNVLYKNFRPILKTGFVQAFQPEMLTSTIRNSIVPARQYSKEQVAIAISRYVSQSG